MTQMQPVSGLDARRLAKKLFHDYHPFAPERWVKGEMADQKALYDSLVPSFDPSDKKNSLRCEFEAYDAALVFDQFPWQRDLFQKLGIRISHCLGDQSSPYYDAEADDIHLFPRAAYTNDLAFQATALHELIHWTAHEKRLNRFDLTGTTRIGFHIEEIVAEIGSLILLYSFGIIQEPTYRCGLYCAGQIRRMYLADPVIGVVDAFYEIGIDKDCAEQELKILQKHGMERSAERSAAAFHLAWEAVKFVGKQVGVQHGYDEKREGTKEEDKAA